VSDELEKLYNLKEKGIITPEEFEYKKTTAISHENRRNKIPVCSI
jgi:hypothetical protein